MADDSLAQWTLDKRAKAAAYDVLTKSLRSTLSRAWAADKHIDEEQVVKALQRAEDVYRLDLARGQETLAARGNHQG